MAEEIFINIIAYDEENAGATPIATFASEEIYQQCWPQLEKYLKEKEANFLKAQSEIS